MNLKQAAPSFLDTPWFALIDVALVALAGGLWYIAPGLGPYPLLIALAAWVLRLSFGRFPFKRTPLDLPLLLFVLTAGVGVWAAYDRVRALGKFWLILDGVLLFYALAGQPKANLWRLAWALGGFGVAISGYFFLTHDWTTDAAKIAALNRLGVAWMRYRPNLPLRALHPNVVAGIASMLAPFLVAGSVRAWRRGRRWLAAAGSAGLAFVFAALLMTISRGAWIALSAALGVWLLWTLAGLAGRGGAVDRSTAFITFLAILALGGLLVIFSVEGGLIGLLDRLPGPARAGSRLNLVEALLVLIGDFPFTGGGLDAFPGLFAHYIQVTPFYLLEHGHNLYLDVALEQGLLGGLALVAALAAAAAMLVGQVRGFAGEAEGQDLLTWAALSGLLALSLHGVMDDALYGSRAGLLLWVCPGMGAAGLLSGRGRPSGSGPDARLWATAAAAVLVLAIYGLIFRQPLGTVWAANRAALDMARIDLSDFPSGIWNDGSEMEAYRPVQEAFQNVLRRDPGNRTAHHRLGLIAMLDRQFETAIGHLETALQASPQHRGLRKNLAYAAIWAGRIETAVPLLGGLPEAGTELRTYVGWWQAQDREDLSKNAQAAVDALPRR